MIEFTCNGCGRRFAVPDHFAGRRAKCKSCGNAVEVPYAEEVLHVPVAAVMATTVKAIAAAQPAVQQRRVTEPRLEPIRAAIRVAPQPAAPEVLPSPRPPVTPQAPAAPSSRTPMRTRRLSADARQMALAFVHFPLISARAVAGDPPEAYEVEYLVRGVERLNGNAPVIRERHAVRIQLTSEYPRQSPKCKMLTPVFHPNIDATTICVGDHWTAGERLVDLVIRIGEMIAYQDYNIQSPLNAEAAMWADLHANDLPIDPRSLRPSDSE